MSAAIAGPVREQTIDIGATLGWYRYGAGDPTTSMRSAGRGPTSSGWFVRATLTPDGPGTLHLTWGAATQRVESRPLPNACGVSAVAYGPGERWLLERAGDMIGLGDEGDPSLENAPHARVSHAAQAHRFLRFGASGDLYHELLPTVIGQRITVGEAYAQWRRLCVELGEPAPGPFEGMLLPPAPERLARHPSWAFHRMGIERARAEPMINLAKHPLKLWEWAGIEPQEAASKLGLLRGLGQWTIGSVLGPALGDPDAVAVGDFHLKNMVGWALAGEARATDERMLELLEPYRGQRGRVTRLLKMTGNGAPRFGPKHRILPMRDW
jgi:3-methyladenine DNA glycosylase/8-oxoguanine DNA glycosylase